jgi:hypothetical protein
LAALGPGRESRGQIGDFLESFLAKELAGFGRAYSCRTVDEKGLVAGEL